MPETCERLVRYPTLEDPPEFCPEEVVEGEEFCPAHLDDEETYP